MNILYLTNHLNTGGITSYVLTLAKGMHKRGHNVYVASSGGELTGLFIEEGVNFLSIPIRTKSEANVFKILSSLYKTLKFIKEKNIAIVHSNTRVTQVLGCLTQYFSCRPHISTCHGFFKTRFSRMAFPCWGRKVIAISEAVNEHLIKDLKAREENITVIHNGIDLDRFSPFPVGGSNGVSAETLAKVDKIEIKRDFGLGDGPVIGIVARLSDVKGHIYLIEAMPAVLEKFPSAQLLIVGEGKMKEELVAKCRRLGIGKKVFFVPSVNDTRGVLQAMDVFVMPSLKEGLGLALMEAMALGLPVIGSDAGGIKSLIHDELNGLLVKPANAKELASAILTLLLDQGKAKSLGSNARIFIENNFSQDKMVLETERIYLECINVSY